MSVPLSSTASLSTTRPQRLALAASPPWTRRRSCVSGDHAPSPVERRSSTRTATMLGSTAGPEAVAGVFPAASGPIAARTDKNTTYAKQALLVSTKGT